MQAMWGVHNDVFGHELIEQGFISLGWEDIGDLNGIGPDRETIKDLLRASRGVVSEGAIRNMAGILMRFAFEMREGDLVVFPNKADGKLNFGLVAGPYEHHPDAARHPHRRPVRWLKTNVDRNHFSPKALYEIGAMLTLFRVQNNDIEFRSFVDAAPEDEDLFVGAAATPQPVDDPGGPVRYDLFAHAMLALLASADAHVPRQEVLRQVEERLHDQITPYEAAPYREGASRPRWQNGLLWNSTQMAGAGWITKSPAGWAITSVGRDALGLYGDGVGNGTGTARAADRAYRAILEERRRLSNERVHLVEATLALLQPGSWTTYGDIAQAIGTNAQTVGTILAQTTADGTHRVLAQDGRPSPGFQWADRDRTESQQEALGREGVRFHDGRADDSQRIASGDLRADLIRDGFLQPPHQRAWLVKGSSVDGHDLVPDWIADGYVSLRAASLRPLEPGITRDELKQVVADDYTASSYASKAAKVDEFDAFLNRMQPDDLVATTRAGRLHLGRIAGEPEFTTSEGDRANLRRGVAWASEDGTAVADLPKAVKAKLNVQFEVVDVSQQYEALRALLEPVVVPRVETLTLPDATDELAASLHVDRSWLDECIDLLRDRPQLIFYGPPGTGKTYLATALAEYLAGDNVRLVQFHPAYSYEDFFEGYRPDPTGGFSLKPGPLRKTVDAARENPATPYFLIIDEINRGNLAKIFGELYFLLEYRDRNVDLLYATDDDIGFSLPENVFIIGTMNTADRSIALVDAAMRRRFAFLPLHPDEPPTRGVLRRWLTAQNLPQYSADLLDALNARIDDPDFKIGPSYLMRPAVHAPGGLERAWRTAILPLLEEFHYGDGTDVEAGYGLNAVRATLPAPPSATIADADAPDDDAHPDAG